MTVDRLVSFLSETWYLRFSRKYAHQFLDGKAVDAATAVQFCCLHFGMTRQQVRQLALHWCELRWLRINCAGWYLLKPPEEFVEGVRA